MYRHNTVLPSSKSTPTSPMLAFSSFTQLADFAVLDEQTFLQVIKNHKGESEKEIRDQYQKHFGGIDKFLELARKEDRKRDEVLNSQSTVSLGRKPKSGEEVMYAPLGGDLAIRVYGGDLEQSRSFSFDFVDKSNRHILTPPGIKIYTEASGLTPRVEVLSIESSMKKSAGDLPWFKQAYYENAKADPRFDPNWETYAVPEGTLLSIERRNGPPYLLRIPTRAQGAHTLTLQHNWGS